MTSMSQTLHERIHATFDDTELRTFCFDHYRLVYEDLTVGMTKGQMVLLLLAHVAHQNDGERLLDILEQERPGLVGAHRVALLQQLLSSSQPPRSVPASGTVVQINAPVYGAAGVFHGPVSIVQQRPPPPAMPAREEVGSATALLGTLPASEVDTIPLPGTLPHVHRMPLTPNPLFVGRDVELRALAQHLKTSAATVAILGMGGLGKTQLAAEFVHRYGRFFAGGTFWLRFADPAGIPGEVAACGGAGALELFSAEDELTLEERVQRVRAAWETDLPRLLVFDNCEDESLLAAWRPRSGACRLIVTSRRTSWSPSMRVVTLSIPLLSRPASVALLRAYRPELSSATADAISGALGDLPLALHLAGGYLARYRSVVGADYLAQLQRPGLLEHPSMQGRAGGVPLTDRELHLARAFSLSYDRLIPDDPIDMRARLMLGAIAALAPGAPVPRRLAVALGTPAALPEDDSLSEALDAEDALLRLLDLGLLDQDTDDRMLRMHGLVAQFTQVVAGPTDDSLARAATTLAAQTKWIERQGDLYQLVAYREHFASALADPDALDDATRLALMTALAQTLIVQGDDGPARLLLEDGLAQAERLLPPDHPTTADLLNNLAGILFEHGDMVGTRALMERALSIRERVLGSDHPETIASLHNLALVTQEQGDDVAARALLEQVLASTIRVSGDDHPDTADTRDNLAQLLLSSGELDAAQAHAEQALAVRERVLGPDHPDVGESLTTLAQVLVMQGHIMAARSALERAVANSERSLGESHPDTALSMSRLADVLAAQGATGQAAELLGRALATYERVYGLDHPETGAVRQRLAALSLSGEPT
jgi:tetratricopeptide (TPR) repeat protein